MSDFHDYFEEEIEVTLKLKVKIKGCHHYYERTEEMLKQEIEMAKKEIPRQLAYALECHDFHGVELFRGLNGYNNFDFEVEEIKQ